MPITTAPPSPRTWNRTVWHRGADGIWRVLFDDGVEPRPATDAEAVAFRQGRQTTCPQA